MKTISIEEVGELMAWRGKAMTKQAVRYRLKQSEKRGVKIKLFKAKGPHGYRCDHMTLTNARRLCSLWSKLHVELD